MAANQKNVLLIVVDQWRGDTLKNLGHPVIETPNIESLASEGVTFAKHYTQAVPCGPGRASMLTGLYMMTHRAVQNNICPKSPPGLVLTFGTPITMFPDEPVVMKTFSPAVM
jgi:arylsulfatase A-like enzyme